MKRQSGLLYLLIGATRCRFFDVTAVGAGCWSIKNPRSSGSEHGQNLGKPLWSAVRMSGILPLQLGLLALFALKFQQPLSRLPLR